MTPEQPSSVAAAAKRHGMEVIDTLTADALRAEAATDARSQRPRPRPRSKRQSKMQ